ncbi:alpha/beta-hydrolase [Colletotrichum zoysiae]|uniref:Alpha/beta-hydrolase n=1 Tax=Colletotrichum zoysiae TaxID=1216348 RepID=A0AAD9HR98_9PEZI|nr:alpha/beta-hydrolase [Colletotrichum zoysiae]
MATAKLPGRLGDKNSSLATDPRTHPGQLQALRANGLHELSYLTTDLSLDAPLSEIMAFVRDNEKSLEALHARLDYHVEGEETDEKPLVKSEQVIEGPDGNMIRLFITRLAGSVGQVDAAALVYFHSGGMIILDTLSPVHVTWAESLARTGFVVVAVDFRNALGPNGLCPFPAGLNDCATAVRWVDSHRVQLGVNRIVLQGDSGGGNLALATTLKAKREGWLSAIDGVCAAMPYISNAYHMPEEWKLKELPSLVECDGYLISSGTSSLNAKLYDPTGAAARNPLAWPYWVEEQELEGLPPHFITVNELDPLRDEGVVYYNKLARAGVRVTGKVNLGVVHEADMFLRNTLPDLYLDSLWAIRKFSDRLKVK